MSTIYVPSALARHAGLPEDWPSGILVASDGRPSSDAAIIAAARLAGTDTFGVLGVLAEEVDGDGLGERLQDLRWTLEAQVERVLGDANETWIEVRAGLPAPVVASYAATHAASLLVTGIGRPRIIERLNGDESALRLARATQTPLFIVAPDRAVPPRRIVVGLDMSLPSLRAAQLARAVAAPDAEIILVRVRTYEDERSKSAALRRHVEIVQTGFCGRVTGVELRGDAATELLAFASRVGADAIAIGKCGRRTPGRLSLGPVASRAVRCAPCSVLIALPED